MIGFHVRQVSDREPVTPFQGLRLPVAFILCPLLCLQACATSPIPPGSVLSRTVVEDMIELQADPETASHLPHAEEVARLRDPRVLPVSVVIRNGGTTAVVVGSETISLRGDDGRVFPVAERVQKARAPAFEPPEEQTAFLGWIGDLGQDPQLAVPILIPVVATMPLWLPPLLIARHLKGKSREQRRRNAALERLETVYLAKGEAVGGVFYFALEGDLLITAATTTLVVPVRQFATGEEHRIQLHLGKRD